MAKNRIRLTQPIIRSRAELEVLVREIAELTIEHNTETCTLDREITEARERHEKTLEKLGRAIQEKTEVARTWAEANPSEFGTAKSIELIHGVIGWRTGQWMLKALSGWTWDRVLEKIKALGKVAYVRTKEEVNKAQIIIDRETLTSEQMREMGVRTLQEESFYIEPKLTELETRQTVDAAGKA